MEEALVDPNPFGKGISMRASIEKLSQQIRNQPHLDESEKEELLSLVSGIESEVESEIDEAEDHPVQEAVNLTVEGAEAQSIPEQLEENLLKLEASYPTTVSALNRIAHVLSRMGI